MGPPIGIIFALLTLCSFCCVSAAWPACGPDPPPPDRIISSVLVPDSSFDKGRWGADQLCPSGSFAADFELKHDDSNFLDTDETAVNAVKLYCANLDYHPTGYVTSTEGEKGEWKGMRVCQTGFLTGVRAQILPHQGVFRDDVAVQNLEMECDYGREILKGVEEKTTKIPYGVWGPWGLCREDSAVCGLKVRYDSLGMSTDDIAVTDFRLYCCPHHESTSPPSTTTPDRTTYPPFTATPDRTTYPPFTATPDQTTYPPFTATPDHTTYPPSTATPDHTTYPPSTTTPDHTTYPPSTTTPDHTTYPPSTTTPDHTTYPPSTIPTHMMD